MQLNATLLGQMISFFCFIGFTIRYVWPPIQSILKQRQDQIALGLLQADEAKRVLQEAEHEAGQLKVQTQKTCEVLVKNAHIEADRILLKSKEEAKLLRERFIDESRLEIQKEIYQAKQKLMREFAEMLELSLSRLLEEAIDPKMQKQLLIHFLQKNQQGI